MVVSVSDGIYDKVEDLHKALSYQINPDKKL